VSNLPVSLIIMYCSCTMDWVQNLFCDETRWHENCAE